MRDIVKLFAVAMGIIITMTVVIPAFGPYTYFSLAVGIQIVLLAVPCTLIGLMLFSFAWEVITSHIDKEYDEFIARMNKLDWECWQKNTKVIRETIAGIIKKQGVTLEGYFVYDISDNKIILGSDDYGKTTVVFNFEDITDIPDWLRKRIELYKNWE